MPHIPPKLQQLCLPTIGLFLPQHFLRPNLLNGVLEHFGVFFELIKEGDALGSFHLLVVMRLLFGISVIFVL